MAERDAALVRLLRKSRSNQAAIAVGALLSPPACSIPALGRALVDRFGLSFSVDHELAFYQRWNELLALAETTTGRAAVYAFLGSAFEWPEPSSLHRALARIPISNFIDLTFDRSLHRALLESGREPVCHDWDRMSIGAWTQTDPRTPNLFFCLPNIKAPLPFIGLFEPTGHNPNNPIQIENMAEMLSGRDLALIGVDAHQGESVLHLERLCLAAEKIYVDRTHEKDGYYWIRRGVYAGDYSVTDLVERLTPHFGTDYSLFDAEGMTAFIDAARSKRWDSFISHFSGDKPFSRRIAEALRLRGIRTWMDDDEIDIGESLSAKIEQGLTDSYTFMIILSPEALTRPWVKEELRAAYARRFAGSLTILPVLHKECEIPPFLADYRYADFRDDKRYGEQLALLERAIRNAVARARRKK